jgi:hypothetical protein
MKTYDSKVYDLADAFLRDTETLFTMDCCHRLAAHIQQEIEDWIQFELDQREPPVFRDLRDEIERDTRAAIEASRLWGDMLNKAFGGKK